MAMNEQARSGRSGGQPLISVIIPAFNRADLIGQTLDSVTAQTFTDYEIIVVDDGSGDGTDRVVAEYGPRVRLIHQDRRGNAAARNRGIAAAGGAWLCFLDSDDLWVPHKLERQYEDLKRHPGVRVSFPGAVRFDASGRIEPMAAGPHDAGRLWEHLVDHQPFGASLSGVMVQRTCFEITGGFDETLQLSVDWDMWIRLARHYSFRWFEEPLVQVRFHPDGANRDATLRLHMYLKCLRKHRRLFCEELGMHRQWRDSYGDKLLRLGRYLLRQGRYQQSTRYLLNALRFGGPPRLPPKLKLLAECQLRSWGMAHPPVAQDSNQTHAGKMRPDREPRRASTGARSGKSFTRKARRRLLRRTGQEIVGRRDVKIVSRKRYQRTNTKKV